MIVPTPQQSATADTMRRVNALGETPRFWRINALEALYEGHRYDGRPSFWDNSVPLRERAPVVQAQLCRVAVQRVSTLVFGDRSFPALAVGSQGFRVSLTEDDQAKLQALVAEIVDVAHLSRVMRSYIGEGLKTSSACAVLSLVDGLPSLEILPSKWCTPTLDRRGRVKRLLVEYKHPVEGGAWCWYRREIDGTADRVWAPVKVEGEKAPDWSKIAPAEVVALPFCPVVWTRNLPPATSREIDGVALCEGLEDELEALDFELSQLYRNALYNGEPQMVRVGVDQERAAPMGPAGRTADAPVESRFSFLNSVLPAAWRSGSGSPATQKAPGKLWDLPTGGDAKLLESTGAGASIIEGAAKELRRVVLDAAGIVLADPATLGSGDLSARALTLMHAPMLDLADNLRVDYGDALREIVNGFLRLMLLAGGEGVLLASWDAARPVLSRFALADRWLDVPVALQWGAYFEPSSGDVQATVTAAQIANGGRPVLSTRSAVAMAAKVTGVKDVDAEAEAIEADEAKGAARATSLFGAQPPAVAPMTDDGG